MLDIDVVQRNVNFGTVTRPWYDFTFELNVEPRNTSLP
jgi:hypothetical protein